MDPEIAKNLRPNTLRARFGHTRTHNGVHCTDLPEDGGYRHHSTVPTMAANISANDIALNMESWLEDWNDAMVAA